MNVFLVLAHHEPTSFNTALARLGAEALVQAGHDVQLSDLYAMGFDPVSDRRNFTTVKDPIRLKQQEEERYASEVGGFSHEL